jgi:hypothetical protein
VKCLESNIVALNAVRLRRTGANMVWNGISSEIAGSEEGAVVSLDSQLATRFLFIRISSKCEVRCSMPFCLGLAGAR